MYKAEFPTTATLGDNRTPLVDFAAIAEKTTVKLTFTYTTDE